MLMWLRGLSTLKLTLLIGGIAVAIAGSTGFVIGKKWERADRYEAANAALIAFSEAAQKGLNDLNQKWTEEVAKVQVDINEWNLQNQFDNALIQELIAGQATIRSDFRELENTIQITTDVGTCVFSVDAIRLLNQASSAANIVGSAGTGNEAGPTEASTANGSDGGL